MKLRNQTWLHALPGILRASTLLKLMAASSLAILWTLSVLSACSEQQVSYPARQAPAGMLNDAAQIGAGAQLFHDKCASCHGKPSEGRSERADFFEPPAPDFTESDYRVVDPAYLFWRIEVGKTVEPYRSRGSVMPAWGMHFSDEQLWQLVAYIKSRAE